MISSVTSVERDTSTAAACPSICSCPFTSPACYIGVPRCEQISLSSARGLDVCSHAKEEPLLTCDCRWEHTPEWSLTSKLLISKHQQVQLLEAASVLLAMNQDGTTPPDSAKDSQSDQDSASPAASASPEQNDGASSTDTTPPPQVDMFNAYSTGSYTGRHKRYSGQGFSRSYQSAPSANHIHGSSIPSGSLFGHYRHQSHERRPLSSGIDCNQEDEGLAAAVELLSCSFGSTGTPKTVPRAAPVTLPADAPPVPHIPAQYLSQTIFPSSTLTHPLQTESYTRHQVHLDEDIKMEESEESVADDEDYDQRSRGRSDEDDDGVFGRMEE